MIHVPYSRLAAALVLLAPAAGRLRTEPAAGRRAAAAADRDGGEADRARRHRPGRIRRPLRCGGFGRDPRPRLGLSRPDPFPRRPDGQAGRSAVHHRQAAVPEHRGADARHAGAGQGQSRLRRGRSRARQATRARPHHHRADLRPAHPGVQRGARLRLPPTRPRCARPSSISNSPSCARRSPAASATAACRPAISSPAARRAPPRCSPTSSRSTRSASNSPWMRRRICATSDSRAAARK